MIEFIKKLSSAFTKTTLPRYLMAELSQVFEGGSIQNAFFIVFLQKLYPLMEFLRKYKPDGIAETTIDEPYAF